MSATGQPFAARAQCAHLGWPFETAAALQERSIGSPRATASGDRAEMSRVAERFDRIIVGMLDRERAAGQDGGRSLAGRLLDERLGGAPVDDVTLVSMFRNRTAGELGTIAAAVGIIVAYLACDQALQSELRRSPDLRASAMDEILRLGAPLISNGRRTTRPVTLQGPRPTTWYRSESCGRDPLVSMGPSVTKSLADQR